MVVNGVSYWLFGPAATLSAVRSVFGLTHPHLASGEIVLPPVDAFQTSFVAHPVGIALHYVFMPLMLVAALFQFSAGLRARRPRVHRWLGRVFFACLLIGVAGGLARVVTGELYGGALSRLQFSGMAIMTLTCATLGGAAALRRDFVAHQRWMWRTYLVVWSSAVVSRLLILFVVPVLWRWMGGRYEDYVVPYNAVLVASWAFPPVIADAFLELRRSKPARSPASITPAIGQSS